MFYIYKFYIKLYLENIIYYKNIKYFLIYIFNIYIYI